LSTLRQEGGPDLIDPNSFSTFSSVDGVLNCADSLTASPKAAIQQVLSRGQFWLETSAAPLNYKRGAAPAGPNLGGFFMVRHGRFSGYQQPDIKEIYQLGQGVVDLAVEVSPLSGAGKSRCRLRVHFEGQPLTSGPDCEFSKGKAGSLALDYPEVRMAKIALGAEVKGYLSPNPSLLRPLILGRSKLAAKAQGPLGGLFWRKYLFLGDPFKKTGLGQ